MRKMLKIGDRVPDVEVSTSGGDTLRLSSLRGQPYVLFFYPKAFTRGCTIETRRFAQFAEQIEELGAVLLGASINDAERQSSFAAETGATFPLLADTRGDLARAFGVKRPMLPVAKRVTYVVDEKGKIEAVFEIEFRYEEHVDRVLTHLRGRSQR